jgi:hypothetical protein
MKWNLAKAAYTVLFALLIGAFVPGVASACTVTPSSGNSAGDHVTLGSTGLLMEVPQSMAVFPRGHAWGLHKHGAKRLDVSWQGDNDADDDSSTVAVTSDTGTSGTSSNDGTTTSDPPTSTPEPSTLALLGLGTMALGLVIGSRRLGADAR